MEQLAASLKIALICEEKLRDPARAFATLVEALPADPAGRELLSNLERLAEIRRTTGAGCWTSTRASRAPAPRWASASSCCACAPRCASARWATRRARSTRCCAASRSRPTDTATQEEILRLARVTGRWEEAIRVEGHLFALAAELPEKLKVARNAAYLVEHEVKDLGARLPRLPERLPAGARRRRDRRPPVAAGEDHRHLRPVPEVEPAAAGDVNGVNGAGAASAAPADDAQYADDANGANGGVAATAGAESAESADATQIDMAPAADDDEDIAVDVDDVARRSRPTPRASTAMWLRARARRRRGGGRPPAGDASAGPRRRARSQRQRLDPRRRRRHRRGVEDADVIEELDAEELDAEPGEHAAAAAQRAPPCPAARRHVRAAPAEDSTFATPWEELADAYDGAARRGRRDRAGLPAQDRRGLGARSEGHRPRAGRAGARLPASTSRTPRCGPSWSAIGGQYDSWDRVVAIYPRRHRRVRSHRHRGGAAPRRRPPARAARAGRQGRGALREILRLKSDDEVALARVEEICREQQRWEDLANVLEKRTAAPTEALPPGPERREAPARAGGAVRRAAGAALRGDRHARAAAVRGGRGGAKPRRSWRRPRRTPRCWGRTRRWRGCIRASGLWGKVVESLKRQAELTTDKAARARVAPAGGVGLREGARPSPSARSEAYEAILATIARRRGGAGGARSPQRGARPLRRSAGDPGEARRRRDRHGAASSWCGAAPACSRIAQQPRGRGRARCASSASRRSATTRCWRRCCATCAGPGWRTRRRARCRSGSRWRRARGRADSLKRVAELNLELSLLKLDDLHDPAAARKEVEAALEAAPENPAALAALAQLHLKDERLRRLLQRARARGARAARAARARWRRCSTRAASTREQLAVARQGARLLRGGAGAGTRATATRSRALASLLAGEARLGRGARACWNASWR